MFAIQGIYDGKMFHVQESIPVDQEYDVVITFLKPREALVADEVDIKERLDVVESLFDILPSTVTDDEIRDERLTRYASSC